MACFGTQEVVGRTRMSPATKSTAPCLAKAHGAESQKPVCKEPNSMDAITRRRRWRIESRWSRQRVECEMTYVLSEVQP